MQRISDSRTLLLLIAVTFASACSDSTGPNTFTEGVWTSRDVAGVYANVTLDLDAKTWTGVCGDCSEPRGVESGTVEVGASGVIMKGNPCRFDIRLSGNVAGGTFTGTATPLTSCSPIGQTPTDKPAKVVTFAR